MKRTRKEVIKARVLVAPDGGYYAITNERRYPLITSVPVTDGMRFLGTLVDRKIAWLRVRE